MHRCAAKEALGKLEFIARGCGMDLREFLASPLQRVLLVSEPYHITIENLVQAYLVLLDAVPGNQGLDSQPS